ncbi:MAG: hypothetical protein JW716_05215 [Candidatus Aenigmarchaeota archaeon]|nr:hypothetical protein [Candidatus Aenigmarchaeota archaeon]
MKGQSEMIELVIIVVVVVMLIMLLYAYFASTLENSSNLLIEKHKNDRLMFVCTFLPRIYIDGIDRTVGESLSQAMSSGEYMIYYGRREVPVNITIVVEQILDEYLDEGYWKLKLDDNMTMGSNVPPGANVQSCKITLPLITYKGTMTNIYLYRW